MERAMQLEYNPTFDYRCGCIAKAGFKNIDVDFWQLLGKNEDEWNKSVEDILKIMDKHNLKCVQTHPYFYDLRVPSDEIDEEIEFAIKQGIIAGAKLGADWCVVHPRSAVNAENYKEKSLRDNVRKFSEYLEYAVKFGTGLAAENLLPRGEKEPFYGANYMDLCELVDTINDKHLQICWDTGHANCMSFDQAEAVRYLSKRIKSTHVHNNYKDQDWHLPPNHGNIEWDKVMKAFSDIGYDGALTLEIGCNYYDEDLIESYYRHNYAALDYLVKLSEA